MARRFVPGLGMVHLLRAPRQVTRLLQPAGHRPPGRRLQWRDGFALRLPGRRLLLVARAGRPPVTPRAG